MAVDQPCCSFGKLALPVARLIGRCLGLTRICGPRQIKIPASNHVCIVPNRLDLVVMIDLSLLVKHMHAYLPLGTTSSGECYRRNEQHNRTTDERYWCGIC
jgi:hypothetical protein